MIDELSVVAGDYCLSDAELSEDVCFVEAEDVLGRNFGQSFGFYPFGEVVDHYD